MVEYYTLYLPKSNREVRIEISVPRFREGIIFDTLYLLDGQNAFKDSHAAFGRSIRATKALSFAAKEMGKRILGVAIHNSGSDLGRINEYTPFLIDNPAAIEWNSQDLNICYDYCYDFINTIVPFIESNYNTYKSPEHRFIYGSSLAAITAIYMGFKYENMFKYIGAFSTASFLFENEFYKFLNKNQNSLKDVFIYVGGNESSDEIYAQDAYIKSAYDLYHYLKNNGNRTRLVIDPKGIHNEECWGNHLLDFINFIYNEDIYFSTK